MSGGKDGQTLFYRILPTTASSLTSKTTVNWHLKVKDIESSIHILLQQISGSHELNDHTQF